MRHFTCNAEQAFETSATGERLFCPGGLWSRPFIIPDAEVEKSLFKKQVWMLRLMYGWLICGQPLLLVLRPQVVVRSEWFLIYLCVVLAVTWGVNRILFARDLKGLRRASVRLGARCFYDQMAQRHSWTGLFLGFMVSLLFTAGGLVILSDGSNIALGILCACFGGLCAVTWGYSLYLKSQTGDRPTETDEIRRA